MNRLFFSSSLFFILIIAVVAAEPTMITNDYLFVNTPVTNSHEEAVYEIAPPPYTTFTITLSGSTGYVPSMSITDAETEERIALLNAEEGNSITYTYTVGEDRREPKHYLLSLNAFGQGTATYTFEYVETTQNDSGLGLDATHRFREAPLITPGSYEGFLGDEDTIDYYAMDLVAGEELTFTLRPKDKGSLHFTFIDGDYNTRIDQKIHTGEEDLIAKFTATKAQTTWLGIEGEDPYLITIESTEELAEEETPVVVGTEETVMNETEEVIVETLPEEPEESAPATTERSKTTGLVILIGAVLLLVVLALFTMMRKKEIKEEEAEEEKKLAKKTTKKATKKAKK